MVHGNRHHPVDVFFTVYTDNEDKKSYDALAEVILNSSGKILRAYTTLKTDRPKLIDMYELVGVARINVNEQGELKRLLKGAKTPDGKVKADSVTLYIPK